MGGWANQPRTEGSSSWTIRVTDTPDTVSGTGTKIRQAVNARHPLQSTDLRLEAPLEVLRVGLGEFTESN